jgi:hypothetical protein
MRRKILLSLFLFFLTFHIYTAYGQFTSEEIAQRSQWEDFLKTAEIIEFKDVGKGVTKPIWLTLKKGDVVQKAVWKNPEGIQNGYLEGWRYEIAAYEMDKLLDLNMIPPTVEKRFRNKKGSLQLAIDLLYDELEIQEKNIQFPEEMRDNRTDRKYIIRAFDSLIGNEDRTQENILINTSWRLILIDHSRSFRSSRMFTKQLMYGKNGIKGDQPIRRLPRSFVEKIRALTFEKIKEAVGFYLTKREINAIMARKELLLEEIEEMIKEIGEDKVLY